MNVLLPVDGTRASDAALDAFIHQFKPDTVRVRVLYVVESSLAVPDSIAFAEAGAAAAVAAGQVVELRRCGQQIADRALDRLHAGRFDAEADVTEGDAGREIVAHAAAWPADTIVMASHGRHGFDRFWIGSVAEYVLRHAPCAVEIIRPAPGT